MITAKTKTIVLIHGLFVNPASWADWKAYFEAQGFHCYTPANPYHEGEPKFLRKHIDPKLAQVNFEEVVINIVALIDTAYSSTRPVGLTGKPILKHRASIATHRQILIMKASQNS